MAVDNLGRDSGNTFNGADFLASALGKVSSETAYDKTKSDASSSALEEIKNVLRNISKEISEQKNFIKDLIPALREKSTDKEAKRTNDSSDFGKTLKNAFDNSNFAKSYKSSSASDKLQAQLAKYELSKGVEVDRMANLANRQLTSKNTVWVHVKNVTELASHIVGQMKQGVFHGITRNPIPGGINPYTGKPINLPPTRMQRIGGGAIDLLKQAIGGQAGQALNEAISMISHPQQYIMSKMGDIATRTSDFIQMERNFRAMEFATGGMAGGSEKIMEAWRNTGNVMRDTGVSGIVMEQELIAYKQKGLILEESRLGTLESQAQALTKAQNTMKSGLNLAKITGMNVSATAQLFGTWQRELHLSGVEMQNIGSQLKSVAKLTGVSGAGLQDVLNKSQGILKTMASAGTLTTEKVKATVQAMAEAEKVGAGEKMAEALKGLSGRQGFMASSPQMQRLLQMGAKGDITKLLTGSLTMKDLDIKSMREDMIARMGMSPEDVMKLSTKKGRTAEEEQILADTLARYQEIGGAGDIAKFFESAQKAQMTDADRIASLEAELKTVGKGTTRESDLIAELKNIKMGDTQTKLNEMVQSMKKGTSVEQSLTNAGIKNEQELIALTQNLSKDLKTSFSSPEEANKILAENLSRQGIVPGQDAFKTLEEKLTKGTMQERESAISAINTVQERIAVDQKQEKDPVVGVLERIQANVEGIAKVMQAPVAKAEQKVAEVGLKTVKGAESAISTATDAIASTITTPTPVPPPENESPTMAMARIANEEKAKRDSEKGWFETIGSWLPSFAEGGYAGGGKITNPEDADKFLAWLHKGEYVLNPPQTKQFTGAMSMMNTGAFESGSAKEGMDSAIGKETATLGFALGSTISGNVGKGGPADALTSAINNSEATKSLKSISEIISNKSGSMMEKESKIYSSQTSQATKRALAEKMSKEASQNAKLMDYKLYDNAESFTNNMADSIINSSTTSMSDSLSKTLMDKKSKDIASMTNTGAFEAGQGRQALESGQTNEMNKYSVLAENSRSSNLENLGGSNSMQKIIESLSSNAKNKENFLNNINNISSSSLSDIKRASISAGGVGNILRESSFDESSKSNLINTLMPGTSPQDIEDTVARNQADLQVSAGGASMAMVPNMDAVTTYLTITQKKILEDVRNTLILIESHLAPSTEEEVVPSGGKKMEESENAEAVPSSPDYGGWTFHNQSSNNPAFNQQAPA